MLFTSLQFGVFFVLVAVAYFVIPHRYRYLLLLAASYYFYACWKVGYLGLIVASTVVTYLSGIGIASATKSAHKRAVLIASAVINLGFILFFKYFNFFNDTVRIVYSLFGVSYQFPNLDILLPVGISFYTFQALSYTIDVYRGQKSPERNIAVFAVYISFFPQLVAGPIERSTRLLPQFREVHTLDYQRITEGLALMLFGFFKKLVIADRLAIYVNEVYSHPELHGGAQLIVATYFFAFQIYCDFSGYSDIAIGAARILGFDLMTNFRRPYAAVSLADFWRRWHISLSTWFKDYVYIPLGGNRRATPRVALNLFIVFVVSGLWHGASWTFVVWGALHGAFLILSVLTTPLRKRAGKLLKLGSVPVLPKLLQQIVVFHVVLFAWIFFRAGTIGDAVLIVETVFHGAFHFTWENIVLEGFNRFEIGVALFSILFMEVIQIFQQKRTFKGFCGEFPIYIRWPIYYATIVAVVLFGNFDLVEFIYFQF